MSLLMVIASYNVIKETWLYATQVNSILAKCDLGTLRTKLFS